MKDALWNSDDNGSVPCSVPTVYDLYGAMGSHTLIGSCKSQHRLLRIYKSELHSKHLTGETPDISQYLDFGFYDRFWFKEDPGLGETKLARFLGV